MLTSFFGKSSPVNYLLLSVFIIIATIVVLFSSDLSSITGFIIAKYSFVVIGGVFSMLLLDFIIRKNHLTLGNTYAILLFSCFLVSLPMIFLEPKLIFANILILLALRRIFSLASENNRSKKILDAAIYITFASLFYFPAIGFMAFLFLAILRYIGLQFKMMLIPIVGICVVFVLSTTYYLLLENSFSWLYSWVQPISIDFSSYNSLKVLAPITILISITIWTGFHTLYKLPSLAKKERPKTTLLLSLMIISIVVALASPLKNGAEVLFMMPALSILAANYIAYKKADMLTPDMKTTYWFKELLLWSAVLLPVLGFVFL